MDPAPPVVQPTMAPVVQITMAAVERPLISATTLGRNDADPINTLSQYLPLAYNLAYDNVVEYDDMTMSFVVPEGGGVYFGSAFGCAEAGFTVGLKLEAGGIALGG